MQGENENLQAIAKSFNLGAGLLTNLLKSEPAAKQNFLATIKFSKLQNGEQKIGNMLYSIATRLPVTSEHFREPLANWVGAGQIDNPNHLDFAIEYIKTWELKGGADAEQVKKDCFVGVKFSNEQITEIINKHIEAANEKSKKFEFLAKVKEQVPSVQGKLLKDLFEAAWKAKGLPDKVVAEKQKKPKKQAAPEKEKAQEVEQPVFHIKDLSELIGREMKSALNSKQLIQDRINKYGDIVLTRFPPEPNGYLHIGHCKAMRFSFMQAKVNGGKCYLRFDDTNPTKENIEYIQNIKENVRWMGYEPWKITHSSDNFDALYNCAVQLIKQGDAFVCSETAEEMRKKRGEGLPSKDRNRSIEENLKLFNEMRMGLYQEGQYSLRAKIDPNHPNTTLRDPVIYRIRYHSHPHVGDKWCIYPLYDFAHPICDSIEGITHSLCSLEFQIRRELYYWTLDKLNIYKASEWQFSRLNVTHVVLSKRRLHDLIFKKYVNGWDDPRLLTINGMRRRGYPAQAINNFCDAIGVTRRGNENYIHFELLQNHVRTYLDTRAPRTMAVLEPVELIIEDLKQSQILTVPLFPKNQEKGNRKIKFTPRIYVQRSDIKLQDKKGFYGIAPNKVVGLKYAQPIFIKQVKAENGVITQVIASLNANNAKPNSYLNWISVEETFDCEVRNYGMLFNIQKPGEEDNYLSEFNTNSIEVLKGVKIHQDLLNGLSMDDRFQFERKGFYCLDKDSDIQNKVLVWNQTVGLVDRLKK